MYWIRDFRNLLIPSVRKLLFKRIERWNLVGTESSYLTDSNSVGTKLNPVTTKKLSGLLQDYHDLFYHFIRYLRQKVQLWKGIYLHFETPKVVNVEYALKYTAEIEKMDKLSGLSWLFSKIGTIIRDIMTKLANFEQISNYHDLAGFPGFP